MSSTEPHSDQLRREPQPGDRYRDHDSAVFTLRERSGQFWNGHHSTYGPWRVHASQLGRSYVALDEERHDG